MFDGIFKNYLSDVIKAGIIAACAHFGLATDAPLTVQLVALSATIVTMIFAWYENGGNQKIIEALKRATQTKTLASAMADTGDVRSIPGSVPPEETVHARRILGMSATGDLAPPNSANRGSIAGQIVVLAILGSSIVWGSARAQMATKAPPVSTCTTAFCTGPYVGGGLDGNGANADIIGSGLDQSVFGAGAYPTLDGGYQIWNGKWLLAGEAGIGYSIPASGGVTSSGWLAYEEMQIGGTLSALFGTSSPITVPSAISADLIAPYIALGTGQEMSATAFETGAGAKFAIGNNMLLDLGYRYLPFNTNNGGVALKADNLIRLRFNYVFK
jgi:opacity protein-like surface antigen